MGMVERDNIRGLHIYDGHDSYVVCNDCVTEEEWNDMGEDDVITDRDIRDSENIIYFCDRCPNKSRL